MADLKNVNINDTGFLDLPAGNAAARPSSPNNRNLRYNTDRQEVEIYSGTRWENTEEYRPNIPANCLFWYDAGNPQSYPGTGTTWFDLSGNNRHATLTDTVFQRVAGGSFAFNGSTSKAVASIPDATAAHTMICWARWDYRSTGGLGSTDRKTVFKTSGSWNPGLWMTEAMIRPHATLNYQDVYFHRPYLDYDWHMFGQIHDGTNVWLIFDGQIIRQTNARPVFAPGYGSEIAIGNEETVGASTHGWLGDISSAAYFNRALTAIEVSNIFTASAGRHSRSTIGTYQNPAPHASAILKDNPMSLDTYYWIKPPTSSTAYYTYCDMLTDGGAWMLMINARPNNGGQYYSNSAHGQSTIFGTPSTVEHNKSTTSMHSRATINEFMKMPGFKYGRITPNGATLTAPYTGLYQRIGTGRNREWGGTDFDCANRANLVSTNRYGWCITQYQNWTEVQSATNGQIGTYAGGNHYYPTTYDNAYQNFWKGDADGIRFSSTFRGADYSSIGQNTSAGFFWIKVV